MKEEHWCESCKHNIQWKCAVQDNYDIRRREIPVTNCVDYVGLRGYQKWPDKRCGDCCAYGRGGYCKRDGAISRTSKYMAVCDDFGFVNGFEVSE